VAGTAQPLRDRVAVVTGGGRGCGREIALALGAAGARVAVLARTSFECQAVADEIGPEALALAADLADGAACAAAGSTVAAVLGPPLLLVHAAPADPAALVDALGPEVAVLQAGDPADVVARAQALAEEGPG
jgi:NAD(P)-dependent dehydrogenase (short-subunit alcohol dehydrogenase family)